MMERPRQHQEIGIGQKLFHSPRTSAIRFRSASSSTLRPLLDLECRLLLAGLLDLLLIDGDAIESPLLALLELPVDGLGVERHLLSFELLDLVAGREPLLVADADEDVLLVDVGERAAPEIELLARSATSRRSDTRIASRSASSPRSARIGFVERQGGRLLRQGPSGSCLRSRMSPVREALRLGAAFFAPFIVRSGWSRLVIDRAGWTTASVTRGFFSSMLNILRANGSIPLES